MPLSLERDLLFVFILFFTLLVPFLIFRLHLILMIAIIGPKDKNKYKDWTQVNTTSSSNSWSKKLSPMYLGPVNLPDGSIALNVENAWQFSKVYAEHVKDDNILTSYFQWAKKGFSDSWAHRYPMGKGATPLFSLWNNERLDYISARKKIYIPLYANAVKKTEAFKQLKALYEEKGNLVLFDFDGYDYLGLGKTLEDVIEDPSRKMGHAFVLALLLENKL